MQCSGGVLRQISRAYDFSDLQVKLARSMKQEDLQNKIKLKSSQSNGLFDRNSGSSLGSLARDEFELLQQSLQLHCDQVLITKSGMIITVASAVISNDQVDPS